jgi:hypothetical protein
VAVLTRTPITSAVDHLYHTIGGWTGKPGDRRDVSAFLPSWVKLGTDGTFTGFSISGMPCSDFMPCGLPYPSLGQSIWSDVLGLPTGLNCPVQTGILSPLCAGLSPLMDVAPCLAGAGPLAPGQSLCGAPMTQQQCEANAEMAFQNTFDQVDQGFWPNSSKAALTGFKWGAVAGCVATWEIGCGEGAAVGALIGGLAGQGKSMWGDLATVGQAYVQKLNATKACEALPF